MGIPYFSPTSLESIRSTIIPAAQGGRLVSVKVYNSNQSPTTGGQEGMDIDTSQEPAEAAADVHLRSDGILLYAMEASYESGTSPLSAWIPASIQSNPDSENGHRQVIGGSLAGKNPLTVFQR